MEAAEPLSVDSPEVLEACHRLGWPGGPREVQKEVLELVFAGHHVVGVLPTSAGKCLGRGTLVLKYDGSVVAVEDIVEGDLLMGPDSRPRKVLSLCRGHGPLYRVSYVRGGESYVVNENHVLSLKATPQRSKPMYPWEHGDRIVNIGVRKWLESSHWFRHVHKGWRCGVSFASAEVHKDLPPYLLGIWLGDGASRDPRITTMDSEVVDVIKHYARDRGLRVSVENRKDQGKAATYSVRGTGGRWPHCENPLTRALRSFDLLNNKHIPSLYRVNDRRIRLEVLAGLIDSDGHVEPGRSSVDLIFVNERLARDIVFLARSLGFKATLRACKKVCTNNGVEGDYHRVYISGDIREIPVRISRKIKSRRDAPPTRNVLRNAIRVDPVGDGEYFGFQLDGDHLFLLGDFTVTHNSGIYQVPALVRPGMVVVISPLIALMVDQVDRLQLYGIPAAALHSHLSAKEKRKVIDDVQAGALDLLYISPERLSHLDRNFFGNSKIQLFAVDESHCISEWGHDFRPHYQHLGKSLRRFGDHQILALTATATRKVSIEIARVLGIDKEYKRLRYSPDRPNLAYMVVGDKVNVSRMVQRAGLPCLVYGGTRLGVEHAAAELIRGGYRCRYYHAGMRKQDRFTVQRAFQDGSLDVIVATCAFGMGIDHSGIRGVCHLEMPTSLEAYTQEAGRAGRDGGDSLALCRATVSTLEVARSMVPLVWPHPRRLRQFWHRLKPLFGFRLGKWTPDGQIQQTNDKIGAMTGFDAREVSACLRILAEYGNIRRIGYQERPCVVILNERKALLLKGARQKRVIAALREHANLDGEVTGSVAFFRDIIGLDRSYAKDLNRVDALRYEWARRCQIIEQVQEGAAEFDAEVVLSIARRSLARVDAAKMFLFTGGCRREYLLRYFGDTEGGSATNMCCDRCNLLKSPKKPSVAPDPVPDEGVVVARRQVSAEGAVWLVNRTEGIVGWDPDVVDPDFVWKVLTTMVDLSKKKRRRRGSGLSEPDLHVADILLVAGPRLRIGVRVALAILYGYRDQFPRASAAIWGEDNA